MSCGVADATVIAWGICAGLRVHATRSACGVCMLLRHAATALPLVTRAGAYALVWVGVPSLRRAVHTRPSPDGVEEVESTRGVAPQPGLLEGVRSPGLPPKAAVWSLAFVPQGMGPTAPVRTQSLLLASRQDVEARLWCVLVSLLRDHRRRCRLQSTVRRGLEGRCGTVRVGCGARLALERA